MFELNKKIAILEDSENEIQDRLDKKIRNYQNFNKKIVILENTMKLTHSISMISTNKTMRLM